MRRCTGQWDGTYKFVVVPRPWPHRACKPNSRALDTVLVHVCNLQPWLRISAINWLPSVRHRSDTCFRTSKHLTDSAIRHILKLKNSPERKCSSAGLPFGQSTSRSSQYSGRSFPSPVGRASDPPTLSTETPRERSRPTATPQAAFSPPRWYSRTAAQATRRQASPWRSLQVYATCQKLC